MQTETKQETSAPKVFTFDKLTVFFKHTDYHGFLHPYNFFEWTSYVREAFFSQKCVDFRQILDSPIKMMTAKINADIKADSKFGDTIEARFTTCRIKKVSFDVIIQFFNKRIEKVVCKTQHTLVFLDSQTQKFTDIPGNIKDAVENYEQRS